jgi:hypothetical protein
VTAGIVVGPLFVLVVALVTWLERDFLHGLGWTLLDSHGVPYPSGTALGPFGFIQVANFFLTGALLLLFVWGVRRYLPDRRSARVAAVLLGGFGVAFLASAAPTDRDFGGTPSTWHGWMHGMAFLLIVTLSVVAPLTTAFALRGQPRWRPLDLVSLAVGLVCPVLLFVPSDVGFYAFIVVLFSWFAILAVRLGRLSKSIPTRS